MPKPQPACVTLYPWLKSNLGTRCLNPLTGTDKRALDAAVQIIELYSAQRCMPVLDAFAAIVGQMQSSTMHLAYHAIAHVMDWSDRDTIWRAAGLMPLLDPGSCSAEPPTDY